MSERLNHFLILTTLPFITVAAVSKKDIRRVIPTRRE